MNGLFPADGPLSAEGVRRRLRHGELDIRVFDTIGSTNTALKAMADAGADAGLALIAAEQTAGRGRMGRSFFSPAGSGLYMSLLLRPAVPAAQAVRLTACAAAAAAEAIEELSGRSAGIKWVNDIYLDGKKVCGILTETRADGADSSLRYAVIGLGVNLREPEGGFPEELRPIAGAVFPGGDIPELRCRLAAGILDRLADYAADPDDPAILEAYRRRSFLPGRQISIHVPGREPQSAEALGVNEDYSLRVRLPDGSERDLVFGEVSVRNADI